MMRRGMTTGWANSRGLSLVEMLVTMAVGLVLLGGIYQVFFSTTTTSQVQENNSRIQESGRFAIALIKQDVRMAGYMGCANPNNVSVNILAINAPVNAFDNSTVLRGYEGGGGWVNPTAITLVPGSDVLQIHKASSLGETLDGAVFLKNDKLQIKKNEAQIKKDDFLFVSDCSSVDLFRASDVQYTGGKTVIIHLNDKNKSNDLSKSFGNSAEIMTYESFTYFVGINAAGNPSLFRVPINGNVDMDGDGVADELVENVETMQLLYGVDANADSVVDDYVAASSVADWKNVLSVKLALLLRGPTEVSRGELNTTTYSFYGTTIDPPDDRRVRQLFTATVGIRNRLQ